MTDEPSSLCPIPGLGHCLGERCSYWDPEKGCLGVGLCFDDDPPAASADPDPFAESVILGCYEDQD